MPTYFTSDFWDHLSKVWLTKQALQEIDRRNDQIAVKSHSSITSSYRRATRPVITQRRKYEKRPDRSATDIIASLTTKRLQSTRAFAKHGGPDLSNLRGYPMVQRRKSQRKPKCSGNSSTPNMKSETETETKTKSSSLYDRNFQQDLIDHQVFPRGYRDPNNRTLTKPSNWKEINTVLERHLPSLTPSQFSDGAYERYAQADVDAADEVQVTKYVFPAIEGKTTDIKCVSGQVPFRNLAQLTDNNLVPGNPDVYYGARPEQLIRSAREELSSYVVPITQYDRPIAPNFFLHVKGPDGSLAVARRQATYDGALGARGMYCLQSCKQDQPIYDNNTYTITSTYQGGTLKMCTSHPEAPKNPRDPSEYHTTQIGAYAMTNNRNSFVEGAAAYRNLRDWTREQRDEIIEQANAGFSEEKLYD